MTGDTDGLGDDLALGVWSALACSAAWDMKGVARRIAIAAVRIIFELPSARLGALWPGTEVTNLLFYITSPPPWRPASFFYVLVPAGGFSPPSPYLRDLPRDVVREVAFASRSNAGKSSAINTLAGRVRLAYVSKTPGRTQHLNYFALAEGRYFVDLPGYGYARAPEGIRAQWEGLVGPPSQGKREQLGPDWSSSWISGAR